MKPEEQRIAIAEWCGAVWYRHPVSISDNRIYKFLAWPGVQEYDGQSEQWKVKSDGTERMCSMDYMAREFHIPDYLNDLNAMVGVLRERVCGEVELERAFLKELKAIHDRVADSEDITPICEWDMVLVVSECDWLAESLLRSIGKWTDEKPLENKTL